MMPSLTLTGIDEATDLDWIALQNASAYPIEFGILRSPKPARSPRYLSQEAADQIVSKFNNPNLFAYHLCGGYARMVRDHEWTKLCTEIDFSVVGRVQVNLPAPDPVGTWDPNVVVTLQQFAVKIGRPVILQWRGPDIFPCFVGLDLLQDRSSGTGATETEWFRPTDLCLKSPTTGIGYAGGLNPDNIEAAMVEINKAANGKRFWIDCESGVRGDDDFFDERKAEAMIAAVCR